MYASGWNGQIGDGQKELMGWSFASLAAEKGGVESGHTWSEEEDEVATKQRET